MKHAVQMPSSSSMQKQNSFSELYDNVQNYLDSMNAVVTRFEKQIEAYSPSNRSISSSSSSSNDEQKAFLSKDYHTDRITTTTTTTKSTSFEYYNQSTAATTTTAAATSTNSNTIINHNQYPLLKQSSVTDIWLQELSNQLMKLPIDILLYILEYFELSLCEWYPTLFSYGRKNDSSHNRYLLKVLYGYFDKDEERGIYLVIPNINYSQNATCRLTDQNIIRTLPQNIFSISISQESIDNSTATSLLPLTDCWQAIANRGEQLHSVAVKCCPGITDQTLNVLSTCYSLTRLRIEDCKGVTLESIGKFISYTPSLTKLELKLSRHNTEIDVNCTEKIIVPIASAGDRFLEYYSKNESVTNLQLYSIGISDFGFSSLIENNNFLHSIDLSFNFITRLHCITRNTSIRRLILSYNEVNDEGTGEICMHLPFLEYLNLSATNVTSISMKSITQLHQLRILILDRNKQVNDEAISILVQAELLGTLEVLSMVGCCVTDKGVKLLTDCLSLIPFSKEQDRFFFQLRVIDWSDNRIGDVGVFYLISFIFYHSKHTCPHLHTIDLYHNSRITEMGRSFMMSLYSNSIAVSSTKRLHEVQVALMLSKQLLELTKHSIRRRQSIHHSFRDYDLDRSYNFDDE
jgi:hypothetical protein